MEIIKPKIIGTNEISPSQESKGMGKIIDFWEEYSCLKILLPNLRQMPYFELSFKNLQGWQKPGFKKPSLVSLWVFYLVLFLFYFSLYFSQF